jgi:lipoprotein NlpI
LIDFRKVVELDSSDDYAHFRIWLIRARLGEKDAATKELQDYLANRTTGKPDDWELKIGRFLTGQLTETDFLKAANDADKKKNDGQHCEAYFYAGTQRLIVGDKTTATDYFEKCVALGLKDYAEYVSASAELKSLSQP